MIDIGLVTLSLDELPGDQVFLGNLAVGGNFVCCLIIVVIFIGLGNVLGRVYRLEMGVAGGRGGGDFEVIILGESHKGWDHFYGES